MTVAEYVYRMLMKLFGGMTEAFMVGVHLKRIYKVVYLRERMKHEFISVRYCLSDNLYFHILVRLKHEFNRFGVDYPI